MCGIHGVINKASFAKTDLSAFIEQAFIVNSLRGTDAAGVFQLDKKFASFSYKNAVPGSTFAELKHAKRFFADASTCPLTVGHVRAATAGKNVTDNAHPFVAEREDGTYIIGVHNGSLTNWRGHKTASQYEVDSEWALNRIACDGADALEDMSGAYCFVWWDSREQSKLFMVRNEDRPMHLLHNKAKDVLMFGSEAGMLTWLAERNKIETNDTVFSLAPHMLYTFDMSKTGSVTWVKSHAPKYKPPVYGVTSNVNNRHQRNGRWNAQQGRWEDTTDDYYAPGSSVNSFPRAGEMLVDAVNAALKNNRTRRAAEGKGVGPGESESGDNPPPAKLTRRERREAKKAAEQGGAVHISANTNGDGVAPPSWYKTDSATQAEQQAAKTLGVMGELQWLTGVVYEPSTAELLGDIEEWLPHEKVKVTHVGVIRGMSAQAADQHWINNKEQGDWGCVIGVTDGDRTTGRMFIISPLTEHGREQMYKRAA